MHNVKATAGASAAIVRLEMALRVKGILLDDPVFRYLYATLREMYRHAYGIDADEATRRINDMLNALQAQRGRALQHGENQIREYAELAARYTNALITPREVHMHLERLRKQTS